MTVLSRVFVDDRIVPLKHVPSNWNFTNVGNTYVLDLRMCFLQRILFDFKWGDDSVPVSSTLPITEQPSRILKMDVSLNDIKIIDSECLVSFRGIRSFNGSVNRLESFPGIGSLMQLVQLDLSFNFLTSLHDLRHSTSLQELRIAQNNFTTLNSLPLLPRLTYLNVDGNKLEDLNGLQNLPLIREISARKNKITNIISVSACKGLITLDLTNNLISEIDHILNALLPAASLKEITLAGNPITQNNEYQSVMKNQLRLKTLDGIALLPKEDAKKNLRGKPDDDVEVFRQVAKKTYMDRIRTSRLTMEENVRHLQKRIIAMQEDQDDLEIKLKSELEATLSHIDFLDSQTVENFRSVNRKPEAYAYNPAMQFKAPEDQVKRSKPHKTDDVLRLATLQLAKEMHHSKEAQPSVPHFHPHLTPFQDDPFQ